MSKKEVLIYTNGSATSYDDPGRGGYGILLCHSKRQKPLSGEFYLTTGRRMDIMAAIVGLEELKCPCAAKLYTTSKDLFDAMTKQWAKLWKADGWYIITSTNKSRVPNVDLWERLLKLCSRHKVDFNLINEPYLDQLYGKCKEIAKEMATANKIAYDCGYLDDILVRLDNISALNVLLSELPPKILLDYAERARASGRNERAQELASKGNQRAAEERRAKEKQTLLEELRRHFKHDFLNAGNIYQGQCSTHISLEEYEDEKIRFVQSWAKKNNIDPKPDREQAAAIAAVEHVKRNVQVVARAGSGKTATLVNRALFLQQHCGVSPDEMLLLAFNRKAAEEMRDRIASFVPESTPHVMTFHALAYAIVHPEKILYDEPEGPQSQSRVLQTQIDRYVRNPCYFDEVRTLMMAYFRSDWERIVSGGYDRSRKEMLRYRRALRRESLDGTYVKSFGEKVIANFLFEHDVKYQYERNFRWNGDNYRPDFTILTGDNCGVVLEYFGLEGDPDYDDMSEAKRGYWRKKPNWKLLDYSRRDLATDGEKGLCTRLKQDLERLEISCEKLSEDEIWSRIKDRAIDKFSGVVRRSIQRCRKLSLTPEQLSEMVNNHDCVDDVEQRFLDLSQVFYLSYLEYLQTTGEEDFDGLMQKAAEIVAEGKTKFRRRSETGDLKRIQYVLLDEYQDFSELFHRLMHPLQKQNGGVRFFCVGDDWQAINRFAGSDLRFFNDFSEIFADSRRLHMPTNYRSARTIVDVGNALMKNRGVPGKAHKSARGKAVIADLSAFSPTPQEKNIDLGADSAYAVLRLVRKIIDDGKRVILLSRTHSVPWSVNYGNQVKSSDKSELDRFLKALRSRLPTKQKDKLTISTVHSFKGREKDAVIVLDAIELRYPLLHPNRIFTRVFGDSIERLTDEERRLFYVALTRAKEELYILTENNNSSPFLEDLEEYMKLSRLEWSDYPPAEDMSRRITIRVCNQNGRGSKPTVELKDLLIAEGYRWDNELTPWYIVRSANEFSVTSFIDLASWSKSADGVEVRFCDYLDRVLAKYYINAGKWECIFNNISASGELLKAKSHKHQVYPVKVPLVFHGHRRYHLYCL